MKSGRLSQEEKKFINRNKNKINVNAIANKLERSVDIVEKYILETQEPEPEKPAPAPPKNVEEGPQPIEIIDLFAKKSDRGALAMTQAAAMAYDERRKQRADKPPPSGRYKDCIHKIRPDK